MWWSDKIMQIGNRKKFICFLLIFGMLLSGMFGGNAEADNLIKESIQPDTVISEDSSVSMSVSQKDFQNKIGKTAKNRENSSKIRVSKEQNFSPQVRTEELTIRDISAESIKTAGKLRQKTGVLPLYALDCNTEENRLFLYSDAKQNFQIHSNIIIVRYIHQKDGKKRDCSYA